MVLITRQGKQKWLAEQLKKTFDDHPPVWQFQKDGTAQLGKYALAGFEDRGYVPDLKFVSDESVPEFDLGTALAQGMRQSTMHSFSEDSVSAHNEQVSALLEKLKKDLRSTDVSRLAFVSHQKHRQALFEGLKGMTEEEFSQIIARKLEQLAEVFSSHVNGESALVPGELVPRNLCFAVRRGGLRFFVIQEKPRIRTVQIRSLSEYTTYELAMPYIVYVIAMSGDQYDHARIAFQEKPLTSLDDVIGIPALPNVLDRVMMCMPKKPMGEVHTPYEVCQKVIDTFWGADFVLLDQSRRTGDRFTHDRFAHRVFESDDATVKSFDHWEQETKKHGVLFGHESQWPMSKSNVNDMINWCKEASSEVDVANQEILLQHILRIAQSIARDLQVRLIADVPKLPLDDVLKKQLEAHVAQVVSGYMESIGGLAKTFRVNVSATALEAVDVSSIAERAVNTAGVTFEHVQTLRQLGEELAKSKGI